MANVVSNFFETVDAGRKAITYVSPEEQEKRRIARELLYGSLIAKGFTEEQAIQLAKGMRISMEEE